MIKIGIIGMGVISHYYVKAFAQLKQCQLVAVCDLNPEKIKNYGVNGIKTYDEYRNLLQDENVDAVVINLPNNLHYKVCLDALAAGKHVCCEKPLTLALDEAQHLSARSKESGLTLLTAFHRRYNKHLVKAVKRSIDMDQIRAVTTNYDERIEDHAGSDTWYLDPKTCGGGCIADNGPNVFDSLSVLLGTLKLVDIKAKFNNDGIDVGAQIYLQTANGVPVTAQLSWDYSNGERKNIILEGYNGEIRFIDFLKGSAGFKTSLYHEYEGVLQHFCAAITEGLEYGETGVEAVRLVEECYSMLKKNKLTLHAQLVKRLTHTQTNRGMNLKEFESRCVRKGELHELVSTDQSNLVAGDRVDRVGFIGFLVTENAAVIERGDRVFIGEEFLGTVLGFDDCHFPNHYNILISTANLLTSEDIKAAKPGAKLRFEEQI